MKNILTSLIFVSILLVGLNVRSQNINRYPRLKERIERAKLNEIQLKFKLDDVTFDHFRPIYLKYENEVSGIDFRKMAKLMKVNPDSLSATDAELLINDQIKSARRIINLREKYYKEFRTVLSPQQILKLYQIEAELRKEISQEIINRRVKR
jgi:hypothetical protein